MVLMCVFCWDFVEGFGAVIDGFNVCVLLEFIERLYAVIDGFNVCVLLEFIGRLYDVIDSFQCVCSAGIY